MRLSNVLESSRVLPSDVHQQVPFNFVGGSARGESGRGVGLTRRCQLGPSLAGALGVTTCVFYQLYKELNSWRRN